MGLVKQEILRVFRTIPPNFSATDFNSEVPTTSCCVVTLFLVNDDSGVLQCIPNMILAPDSEEMVSLSVAVPERYWFDSRCDIMTKPVLTMEHKACAARIQIWLCA